MSPIDEQSRDAVIFALRHPRGRYGNARTSQLSGIPSSTVYEWRRSGIYVPDFDNDQPTAWSYRDLVFLRLLAWLRQGGMERHIASEQVGRLKQEIAAGKDIRFLRADRHTLLTDRERVDRISGESILPFDDVSGLFRTFNILEPIQELRVKGRRLWAPDLVRPSALTFISPWVMAGDPCVARTRIPTASIHALRNERGLDEAEIVELYPGLTPDAVEDADLLERQLRGRDLPALTAAA